MLEFTNIFEKMAQFIEIEESIKNIKLEEEVSEEVQNMTIYQMFKLALNIYIDGFDTVSKNWREDEYWANVEKLTGIRIKELDYKAWCMLDEQCADFCSDCRFEIVKDLIRSQNVMLQ